MVPCSSCGLDLSVDLKVPTERSIAHKNRIWLMDFSTITVWLSSRFSYCWKFFFYQFDIFAKSLSRSGFCNTKSFDYRLSEYVFFVLFLQKITYFSP